MSIELDERLFNNISNDDDNASSPLLLEELFSSLFIIDESTWNNGNQIEKHYHKHVLRDGEKFNPDDPKFSSNMTIEDYKKEAERLSEAKAGMRDDKTSPIIGFELKPRNENDVHKSPRLVKIKKFVNPKYFPKEARGDGNRYREAVLYVDNNDDEDIITYMIIKDNRFKQYVKYLFKDELPESE